MKQKPLKNMKRILLTYLMLIAAVGSRGAESESREMTLDDCLLYALQHSHRNLTARLETQRASTEVRITASSMMPQLGVYGNGNISFGRNIDPATNTYDNKQTLSTGFGVQLSLPVFDGLVRFNNLRASRVGKLRAVSRERLEQDEVSMEVIREFYQVAYCKTMVNVMAEQLRRDSTDLRATRRGYELGEKSGADVAELEALVAADEFELLNQRNLLSKAELSLRGAMGMPLEGDSLILIETPMEYSAATPATTSLHPRLEEAALAVKGSRYELLAAKGEYFPSISLSGGLSTSYYKMLNTTAAYPSFARQMRDNMGEYLGLSVSLPLFNGLSTTNRVKHARILLKENQLRLEQTQYELEQETLDARLDYESACEESRSAQRRVEAEETAFKATRRKYELGDASAIDLYTAAGKLAAARGAAEGKRIQKIISYKAWRYCLGEPLMQLPMK